MHRRCAPAPCRRAGGGISRADCARQDGRSTMGPQVSRRYHQQASAPPAPLSMILHDTRTAWGRVMRRRDCGRATKPCAGQAAPHIGMPPDDITFGMPLASIGARTALLADYESRQAAAPLIRDGDFAAADQPCMRQASTARAMDNMNRQLVRPLTALASGVTAMPIRERCFPAQARRRMPFPRRRHFLQPGGAALVCRRRSWRDAGRRQGLSALPPAPMRGPKMMLHFSGLVGRSPAHHSMTPLRLPSLR